MSDGRSHRWRVLSIVVVSVALMLPALAKPAPAAALTQAGTGPFLWQNPVPQGDDLNQVSFVSSSAGHAVGRAGTILATTDGGASWSPQRSHTAANLMSISFCDPDHGWAVGNTAGYRSAVLVSTSDAGTDWTTVTLPMAMIVDRVTFVDARHGWIVGKDLSQRYGLIYATSDGGVTWHPQYRTAADEALMGVQFLTAKRGWAVGASDIILSTTNGGTTWRVVHSGGTEALWGLSFSDASHGWVVGQATVLATTDGGAHWQSQAPDLADDRYTLNSVAFADDQVGWAVGFDQWTGEGFTYGTTDGGADWQQQGAASADWLIDVTCLDDAHAWSVGKTGIMRRTADGSDWIDVSPATFDHLYGVAFADQDDGWAVGERIGAITLADPTKGAIVATTDGGATWTAQASVPGAALNGVACIDPDTAWAVGNGGAIDATTDGGRDWTTQGSGTTNSLFSVSFADANDGWAVGEFGTILATTDGGAHWATQASSSPNGYYDVLYSVKAIDADHVCAAGTLFGSTTETGVILTTTDGGQQWVTAPTPSTATFDAVTFVDLQHGWAVGSDGFLGSDAGLVMATTDGGATWFAQSPKLSSGILGVAFADAQHGWAVSGDGVIHATLDGGADWGTLNSGTDTILHGVALADPTHGWVVGEGAVVLASDPTADLTPPDLTASGAADGTWTSSAVSLSMGGTDTGGAGLLGIHVVKDGVKKTVYARTVKTTIAAPASHTADGVHTIDCWSIDRVGNCSPKQVVRVTVDTRRPTVAAYPATARRGGTARLKLRVSDARQKGDYARLVTVTVVNARGSVVKIVTLRRQALNKVLTASFQVPSSWHAGAYRFFVRAVDRAGNRQVTVAANRLVVG